MTKEQYYKRSNEGNLPLRCPILNYCERRAFTIYLNSEYRKLDTGTSYIDILKKNGDVPNDFEKNKISNQGEGPTMIRGRNHFYCNNMCPEVNLFDNSHSLFRNVACVEGSYDSERITMPKSEVIRAGHFSECPEFNLYAFERKVGTQKITNKKKRKNGSTKTKALLQKEINSVCPFCSHKSVEHFHIHHLDGNPQNNDFNNLIMLCPTCHSMITKGDITTDEVRQTKNRL